MSKFNHSSKRFSLNFHQTEGSERLTMFYKALYQLNDVILGLVFLAGSILFF